MTVMFCPDWLESARRHSGFSLSSLCLYVFFACAVFSSGGWFMARGRSFPAAALAITHAQASWSSAGATVTVEN